MRKNISPTLIGVRAHPLVERAAVNRVVVGSSPTRGVEELKFLKEACKQRDICFLDVCRFFSYA